LTEPAKQQGLARHLAALRVGEFEVAKRGGIWVAIRGLVRLTQPELITTESGAVLNATRSMAAVRGVQ
jgi:hypothetical protein